MDGKWQKILRWTISALANLIAIVLFSPLIAAVLIPARQSYVWLQTGDWIPEPSGVLVRYLPSAVLKWIDSPESWLGLHELFTWLLQLLPLSFVS